MTAVAERPLHPDAGSSGTRRWAWADNLRVAVIAGVVVTHVATAYALDVDWYYEERTASPVTKAVLGVVIGLGALFALAALFLVAGALSQRSLARKGPGAFVRDRLVRLGIPLAVFVVIIGPLTSVMGQRAEGEPEAGHAGAFLLRQVRRADTGPMWFVVALLLYSVAYGTWRRARPAPPPEAGPLRGRNLVAAGAVVVVGSFLVRLVWPFAEDTPLSLNLWEWPQGATLFFFGAVAGERGWLDHPLPADLRRACRRATVAGGVGLVAVVAAVAVSGDRGEDAFLGGWHAEALAEPVVEATLAVAATLVLVEWFRRRWNTQAALAANLGRASFAAYVLHPPVVVALSAALRPVAVAADVKLVIVALLGVTGAFAVGWAVTRVRPLARVL